MSKLIDDFRRSDGEFKDGFRSSDGRLKDEYFYRAAMRMMDGADHGPVSPSEIAYPRERPRVIVIEGQAYVRFDAEVSREGLVNFSCEERLGMELLQNRGGVRILRASEQSNRSGRELDMTLVFLDPASARHVSEAIRFGQPYVHRATAVDERPNLTELPKKVTLDEVLQRKDYL